MAEQLKGKPVADALNEKMKNDIAALAAKGITPTLAILRVGERPDDIAYERGAMKRCETVGVAVKNYIFPADVAQDELIAAIDGINKDDSIHGVLLFRPLPEHLDYDKVCNAVAPEKDVDAMTMVNSGKFYDGDPTGFAPCTAQAVMEILSFYNVPLKGTRVALVGWGAVVGKPLSILLLQAWATVTVCHIFTKDAAAPCKNAELLISAAGKAGLIGEDKLSPGQTVIDVGINPDPKEEGKICGDVDFEYADTIVDAITPVPGGVGSVTTSVLVSHVVRAAASIAN